MLSAITKVLATAALCIGTACAQAQEIPVDWEHEIEDDASILVIAHRGASSERPEHTLAAYELAMRQGADFIEPDLVVTKDGVLVTRHENDITHTTDVEDRPEFADRKTTKIVDGREHTGWFTEDFTLSELRSLRARERLPGLRLMSANYDGMYGIPTFQEIMRLVWTYEAETGRLVGIYPELKHPTYFKGLGYEMDKLILADLDAQLFSYANDKVFIQSFEPAILCQLRLQTELPLIQLLASQGGPVNAQMSYRELASPAGLEILKPCVDGIGADMRLILNENGTPTSLVSDAHAVGLKVHAWTLRKENYFLPEAFRSSDEKRDSGNLEGLWTLLEEAGVDGVFTDNPKEAVEARGP